MWRARPASGSFSATRQRTSSTSVARATSRAASTGSSARSSTTCSWSSAPSKPPRNALGSPRRRAPRQGVPSLERALVALRFRPVRQPLRQALGQGHVDYLLSGWDEKTREPTKEALAALDERLQHVADGLAWMRSVEGRREPRRFGRRTRFTTILRRSSIPIRRRPTRPSPRPRPPWTARFSRQARWIAPPSMASTPRRSSI